VRSIPDVDPVADRHGRVPCWCFPIRRGQGLVALLISLDAGLIGKLPVNSNRSVDLIDTRSQWHKDI
jgi:hypothetical protein